jgi:flagellar hook protein FlgE
MLCSPARMTGERQRPEKETTYFMTGSMYAAISGLKTHMSKLNVIGNNVANANTYAYKSSRMTFRESMYTTLTSGSDGGNSRGGINPSQIGFGVTVGTIDLNMSSATYAPTGYDMDCMIDGDGFFLVGDKNQTVRSADEINKLELTRMGDLGFDRSGYLVDGAGRVVYGFSTVQNPNYNPGGSPPVTDKTIVSTELVPIRLPLSAAAPTVTNGGKTAGSDSRNWEEGAAVYPVLSAPNTANANSRHNIAGDKATQPTGTPTYPPADGVSVVAANTEDKCIQLESMSIDASGRITGINVKTKETVVVGYVAVASVDNASGVTHTDGPYYKALGGAGDVRVSVLGGALDGKYLNNKVLDPATSAGITTRDAILNGGNTSLRNGGLEASGTDIANEFSEMITTQRGYQANTRIITVTDSMLEELVNIKR